MSKPSITVEMLHDHPLLRFPYAFATRGNGENLEGQINLSIQNLEEAKTLRDALSAFIEFHEEVTDAMIVGAVRKINDDWNAA